MNLLLFGSSLSQMQGESETEGSIRSTMESLKRVRDSAESNQQQKIDSFSESLQKSLKSIKAQAEENAQNQAKLASLKADLREAEADLVKVLAEKTRQEAKQMAIRDSVSATKPRIEELKRIVHIQRARRNEFAATLSQQSIALATFEEKKKEDIESSGEIQEAISWYNQVLGFQIEGGHGVKFTFKNLNINNPNKEYSFTIRLANDTYALLECDPHLNSTDKMINQLNRKNDLFKFVRIMREEFQNAAALGLLLRSNSLHQDFSTISTSAPVASVSTGGSESPSQEN